MADNIGRKRFLVSLANPGTKVAGTDGQYTTPWDALDPPTMFAAIKPATARDLERATANASSASATHLVTMGYHAGVTTKTRLQWTDLSGRTRNANVTGVSNTDERNIELVLLAQELVR